MSCCAICKWTYYLRGGIFGEISYLCNTENWNPYQTYLSGCVCILDWAHNIVALNSWSKIVSIFFCFATASLQTCQTTPKCIRSPRIKKYMQKQDMNKNNNVSFIVASNSMHLVWCVSMHMFWTALNTITDSVVLSLNLREIKTQNLCAEGNLDQCEAWKRESKKRVGKQVQLVSSRQQGSQEICNCRAVLGELWTLSNLPVNTKSVELQMAKKKEAKEKERWRVKQSSVGKNNIINSDISSTT